MQTLNFSENMQIRKYFWKKGCEIEQLV